MKITVLFDKDRCIPQAKIGWGLSLLIGQDLLFDTGENGEWLLSNMVVLGINPEQINTIVISHEHWDHIGGLWDVLACKKGITVYGCPGFSPEFQKRVESLNGIFEVPESGLEIGPGLYTTGALDTRYADKVLQEQSLIVRSPKGISLLTGCAHPGIVRCVEEARRLFPSECSENGLALTAGGFHLLEKTSAFVREAAGELKRLDVRRAGPTHCSGPLAEKIFFEEYGRNFQPMGVGRSFEI